MLCVQSRIGGSVPLAIRMDAAPARASRRIERKEGGSRTLPHPKKTTIREEEMARLRWGTLGRRRFYLLSRRILRDPGNASGTDKTWVHRLMATVHEHFRKARAR